MSDLRNITAQKTWFPVGYITLKGQVNAVDFQTFAWAITSGNALISAPYIVREYQLSMQIPPAGAAVRTHTSTQEFHRWEGTVPPSLSTIFTEHLSTLLAKGTVGFEPGSSVYQRSALSHWANHSHMELLPWLRNMAQSSALKDT